VKASPAPAPRGNPGEAYSGSFAGETTNRERNVTTEGEGREGGSLGEEVVEREEPDPGQAPFAPGFGGLPGDWKLEPQLTVANDAVRQLRRENVNSATVGMPDVSPRCQQLEREAFDRIGILDPGGPVVLEIAIVDLTETEGRRGRQDYRRRSGK